MKITFAPILLVFVFILTAISVGLSNPINGEKSPLDEFIFYIDANLTTIENDLIEKKLEKEIVEIKSNRQLLTGQVRKNLTEANEFSIKYQKYWTQYPVYSTRLSNRKFNGRVFEGGYPLTVTDAVLFLIDDMALHLMRIQIGLTRDNLFDEAANAEKLRNTLKDNVESVIEKSDDFLEKYMRLPDQDMSEGEIEEIRRNIQEWMKNLIPQTVEIQKRMENNLRRDKKVVEADEVKSLMPSFNQELGHLEVEVIDFMFKYIKYWYHEAPHSMTNQKDIYTIVYMIMIRGQARAMKKCNNRLIEDNKPSEAKEALRLKEEVLNKVIPPFETAFWMGDFYIDYI